MIISLLLIFLHHSSTFLITESEPSMIIVAPGDIVRLGCVVDEHYEWCKFYHPSGRFCDFEWKRFMNNITMQDCAFSNRVSFSFVCSVYIWNYSYFQVKFHGKYDDRECGISFTATKEDTGIWKWVSYVASTSGLK